MSKDQLLNSSATANHLLQYTSEPPASPTRRKHKSLLWRASSTSIPGVHEDHTRGLRAPAPCLCLCLRRTTSSHRRRACVRCTTSSRCSEPPASCVRAAHIVQPLLPTTSVVRACGPQPRPARPARCVRRTTTPRPWRDPRCHRRRRGFGIKG